MKNELKYKNLSEYKDNEINARILEINAKRASGVDLSPEDNLLIFQLTERQEREEESNRLIQLENEKAMLIEKEKKVLDEFEAAPSDEKILANVHGELIGGAGKINEFLSKKKLKKIEKKVQKKGGSILLKAYKDTAIELIWLKKPASFVEFISQDETGNKIQSVSRITKNKHRLKGSSVPVHIAVEGDSENTSLLEGTHATLSAKYVNGLLVSYFDAGRAFEADLEQSKKKKFDLASASVLLMLIMLGVMIYLAWQQYQLFELMQKIPEVAAVVAGSV